MATSSRRRVLLAVGLVKFKDDDEPPPPETVGSIAVLVGAALVMCVGATVFGIWLGGVLFGFPLSSSDVGSAVFFAGGGAVVGLMAALRERQRARSRRLETPGAAPPA